MDEENWKKKLLRRCLYLIGESITGYTSGKVDGQIANTLSFKSEDPWFEYRYLVLFANESYVKRYLQLGEISVDNATFRVETCKDYFDIPFNWSQYVEEKDLLPFPHEFQFDPLPSNHDDFKRYDYRQKAMASEASNTRIKDLERYWKKLQDKEKEPLQKSWQYTHRCVVRVKLGNADMTETGLKVNVETTYLGVHRDERCIISSDLQTTALWKITIKLPFWNEGENKEKQVLQDITSQIFSRKSVYKEVSFSLDAKSTCRMPQMTFVKCVLFSVKSVQEKADTEIERVTFYQPDKNDFGSLLKKMGELMKLHNALELRKEDTESDVDNGKEDFKQTKELEIEKRYLHESKDSEWRGQMHFEGKDAFCLKIGDLNVRCCVGDITEDKVDAIVNGSNSRLDLTKGTVSQIILLRGGQVLERELNSDKIRDEMKQNQLAVTSSGDPGNMSCMFIFHVDVKFVQSALSQIPLWRKLIIKCLKKAEEMKITSLAFPALGTGHMQGSIATTCQFFMDALCEFTKKKVQFLHDVHIVVLDHDVLASLFTEIRSYHIANDVTCEQQTEKPDDLLDIQISSDFDKPETSEEQSPSKTPAYVEITKQESVAILTSEPCIQPVKEEAASSSQINITTDLCADKIEQITQKQVEECTNKIITHIENLNSEPDRRRFIKEQTERNQSSVTKMLDVEHGDICIESSGFNTNDVTCKQQTEKPDDLLDIQISSDIDKPETSEEQSRSKTPAYVEITKQKSVTLLTSRPCIQPVKEEAASSNPIKIATDVCADKIEQFTQKQVEEITNKITTHIENLNSEPDRRRFLKDQTERDQLSATKMLEVEQGDTCIESSGFNNLLDHAKTDLKRMKEVGTKKEEDLEESKDIQLSAEMDCDQSVKTDDVFDVQISSDFVKSISNEKQAPFKKSASNAMTDSDEVSADQVKVEQEFVTLSTSESCHQPIKEDKSELPDLIEIGIHANNLPVPDRRTAESNEITEKHVQECRDNNIAHNEILSSQQDSNSFHHDQSQRVLSSVMKTQKEGESDFSFENSVTVDHAKEDLIRMKNVRTKKEEALQKRKAVDVDCDQTDKPDNEIDVQISSDFVKSLSSEKRSLLKTFVSVEITDSSVVTSDPIKAEQESITLSTIEPCLQLIKEVEMLGQIKSFSQAIKLPVIDLCTDHIVEIVQSQSEECTENNTTHNKTMTEPRSRSFPQNQSQRDPSHVTKNLDDEQGKFSIENSGIDRKKSDKITATRS